MTAFAGFIVGSVPWIIVGWLMKRDSYTRHYVRIPVVAPEPAPLAIAPVVQPVVHLHLMAPAAPAPLARVIDTREIGS